MVGSLPLVFWYVSALGLSVLALAGTAYAVSGRTEAHHRAVFVGYVALQICWVLTAMAKLLVQSPPAKYGLSLLANVFATFAIAALGYFATVYTGRSPSPWKPRNGAYLCWVAVAVASIVTQPLFGLQYASVSYRVEPFAHLAIEPGPVYLFSVLVTVLVITASISYLARLFVESPHRPSSSILLLCVAAALSLVPNALSTLSLIPMVPGYDYSVFGTVPFTVSLAYVVFFRGELDLAPMARNEVVEEIDDALFGLDDAGKIVDYNAAARDLLPGDTDDPIGAPLAELLPELADQLQLSEGPEEVVPATYTTVTGGTRAHYSVSVSTIIERETVAGYSVVLRDVTDAETTKRELERQNAQLESFAGTVAHDLRNPLQIADGTATLLAGELRADDDPHPAVDHLDRVGDAVSRMDDALNELQTLARHAQSVTETESLPFEATVLGRWDSVDTDGLLLSVPIDGTIRAEPTRLNSILETLFRHSAEYGGPTVTVELTESGFVYRDEGLAIPDDGDVFDDDATADHFGLGLKIVRTQVESQGWRVRAEPVDSGTAFHVTEAETSLANSASEVSA